LRQFLAQNSQKGGKGAGMTSTGKKASKRKTERVRGLIKELYVEKLRISKKKTKGRGRQKREKRDKGFCTHSHEFHLEPHQAVRSISYVGGRGEGKEGWGGGRVSEGEKKTVPQEKLGKRDHGPPLFRVGRTVCKGKGVRVTGKKKFAVKGSFCITATHRSGNKGILGKVLERE